MEKVCITGIGAISAIGFSVNEQIDALRAGRNGLGHAKHFQSVYAQQLHFGEIDLSDEALRERVGNLQAPDLTRTSLIAIHAFQEALNQAQLDQEAVSSRRTGFISSSTVGGMCYTDHLYNDANNKETASQFVKSYEGSDHTLQIVRLFNIKGFTDTINTACSSSANAILLGCQLINAGKLDRVIVGGADCLAKYTVNGFNSLRILSENQCAPFDANRDGLNLGEAGAYLVLEKASIVGDKPVLGYVSGWGNANDAFHPSATSDEAKGPLLAMNAALNVAGLQANEIDYINAHGTGTQNNDQTESFAFQQLFDKVPPYNSTKSYTGHTLAAAGALEAIFTLSSLMHQELYPSLQIKETISDFEFQPIKSFHKGVALKHAQSNSFGFGGNCTSLILSACL
jgi:3-oxoacyl-(acyl-carrier-protein) synthase